MSFIGTFAAAHPAHAQQDSPIELFGSYTLQRESEFDVYGSGWSVGAGWTFTNWLAIVGDVGGNYWDLTITISHLLTREPVPVTIDTTDYMFLIGPKFSAPTMRVTPFGQVLGGVARRTAHIPAVPFVTTGSDFEATHAALSVGGGIDLPIGKGVAVRIALDYRRVFTLEFDKLRLSTGMVVGIGRR